MTMPNYRKFVETIDDWSKHNILFNIHDMMNLAKECECEIPDEIKKKYLKNGRED